MKNLNEDIRGKGIPRGYPERVKRRAKEQLGIRGEGGRVGGFMGFGGQPMPSREEMETGSRLMGLANSVKRLCRGKERQLEGLAYDVIMSNYTDIIKRHKMRFEIRIVDSRTIYRNLTENVEDETFKKRITNLITQGEAKNTKGLLHTEQVQDGLREIFGGDWREVYRLFVELVDTASKLDWLADPEIRYRMMQDHPEHFAGSVRVEFDRGDEINEEMQASKGVLIKAYGLDFTMLLHEAVKGIFQVLSSGSIPSDRRVAREVMRRTGLSTEPEDWQYGPEIAADLRDFINENPKVDQFPDARFEVYKMMVDKRTMATTEFLKFMEGILDNTKEARKKMDELIDEVTKRLGSEKEKIRKAEEDRKQMEEYDKQMEEYEREMEEYNRKLEEFERQSKQSSEIDDILAKSADTQQQEEGEEDYSTYSQSQLQSVLNRALDNEDYDLVRKVSTYLKESKKYNFR